MNILLWYVKKYAEKYALSYQSLFNQREERIYKELEVRVIGEIRGKSSRQDRNTPMTQNKY